MKGGPKTRSKLAVHDIAVKHGWPVVPIWLVWKRGAIERGDPSDPRFQASDLVIKPARGKGGRGIKVWRTAGGDVDALLASLRRKSARKRLLIQPLIANHPELATLAGGALSTLRIVTARNEEGRIEVTDAVFKMAADAGPGQSCTRTLPEPRGTRLGHRDHP